MAAKRKKKTLNIDVSKHVLVPKHTKVSEKEKASLLKKYNITLNELPKIFSTDQAIKDMKLKYGDIVKIERPSLVAGKAVFYRSVVEETEA